MEYFKLNQTVYHPIYGEGKVDEISKEICTYPIKVLFKDNNKISFTKTGREIADLPVRLSQNPIPEIVNKPLEDKYEPFTYQDRELLKGKWIGLKNNKVWEAEIVFINNHKIGVLVNSVTYISYEDLLKDYEFSNGEPCGKKVL